MRTSAIVLFFVAFTSLVYAQQIAITFDDAPLGDGPVFNGYVRTEKILSALKKHGVDQAAFFVVTGAIDSMNSGRLDSYSKAGHLLANHSHSHRRISSMGTAGYIRDIKLADSILQARFPYKKWYRFPFLDEGKTISARDSIRSALSELNIAHGYVTVDNYDWHLNGALRKAVKEKASIDYELLKQVYIDHIWRSIQYYDNIGQKVLGRSPKHVLLLHENDLAALYLDDLLSHLKSKGWKIISAEDAYSDPIASQVPDVLFNNQGRVGAIAFSKGMKPAELVQESEDEKYLDDLLLSKSVFK